jgi:hypothetical protein
MLITSAEKFPDDVKKFIETELRHGALVGPVDTENYDNIHISPLMSRPKEGDARRIIVDLSWPKKEGASVNSGVPENKYLDCEFILKLPTVDPICKIINAFEVPIYKINLARAFRQIPIDPLDIVNLGVEWEGNCYLNTVLPFDFRHGSAICQRITDAMRYILSKTNITLVNYIDDFIAIVPVQCADEMFEITKKGAR